MPGKRVDDIGMAIADRVKFLRHSRHVSQAVLAGHLGVSTQQMQKYETGQSKIAANTLVKIARYLDVPVIEMIPATSTSANGLPKELADAVVHLHVPNALRVLKSWARIGDVNIRNAHLLLIEQSATQKLK